MFDKFFSSDGSIHDHVTCYFKHKSTTRIFHTIQEEDGLSRLNVSPVASRPVAEDDHYSPENGIDCHICIAATQTHVPLLHENQALDWHYRTEQPSAERHMLLSQTFPSVPSFTRNTLRHLLCIPCTLALGCRSLVVRTYAELTHPFELIHIDITRPILANVGGSIYSLSTLDVQRLFHQGTGRTNKFFPRIKGQVRATYGTQAQVHSIGWSRRK